MLRPERPSAEMPRPFEPAEVSRPVSNGDRAAASAAFASLRGEIEQFIEQGSPPSAEPALNAQARLAGHADDAGDPLEMNSASGLQAAFLGTIAPWAREAGERLGVAPEIIAAQAALESGWGAKPLRKIDGADAHNYFGIKASSASQGGTVDTPTTEFEAGSAVKTTARFRQYADTGAGFRDFTQLLLDNPRYQAALNTGDDARAYARALAQGGYATDPQYATKLAAVVARLRAKD